MNPRDADDDRSDAELYEAWAEAELKRLRCLLADAETRATRAERRLAYLVARLKGDSDARWDEGAQP